MDASHESVALWPTVMDVGVPVKLRVGAGAVTVIDTESELVPPVPVQDRP